MVVPPGYGVGDFIAVGQLTWKVYRACKGAPGEFQELSRELSTLRNILDELEEEAKTPKSLLNRRGSSRKGELDEILRNVSVVLGQIDDIATRYASLGRDQKRAWDRVRFAGEDLAGLRSKLSLHINEINLFIASLSAGSLARIEGLLNDLVRDDKEGKKELSVISTHDTTDEAAWNELERELIGDGITMQDIERYKEDIKQYLKELVIENLVDVESESADFLSGSFGDLDLDDRYSPNNSIEVIAPIRSQRSEGGLDHVYFRERPASEIPQQSTSDQRKKDPETNTIVNERVKLSRPRPREPKRENPPMRWNPLRRLSIKSWKPLHITSDCILEAIKYEYRNSEYTIKVLQDDSVVTYGHNELIIRKDPQICGWECTRKAMTFSLKYIIVGFRVLVVKLPLISAYGIHFETIAKQDKNIMNRWRGILAQLKKTI